MRTKQVADEAGVNTQTLRYYERRGLLDRPPRSSAGYRDYPASVVELLRFVKRAQGLGFSLDEVEQLLHLADGGPDSCERARALADHQVRALDGKIAELARMRAGHHLRPAAPGPQLSPAGGHQGPGGLAGPDAGGANER